MILWSQPRFAIGGAPSVDSSLVEGIDSSTVCCTLVSGHILYIINKPFIYQKGM